MNVTYPLNSVNKTLNRKSSNAYLKFAFWLSINFPFKMALVVETASFDPLKKQSVISGNSFIK